MLPSLALAAFFSIVHADGRDWISTPDGGKLWSFGVDCVGPGESWDRFDPKNVGYAGFRLFENERAWATKTNADLRSWGFNSLGGWSDYDRFRTLGSRQLPYFVVLHLGAYDKAPWHDIYGKDMSYWIDKAAHDQIPKIVRDPYLIGYFTDNELGWWDDTLLGSYLSLPASSPGRIQLENLIERHYHHDFSAFAKDWISPAKSFAALRKTPKLWLRPGGSGISVVHEWAGQLAGKYYQLVHDAVRRYDPKRLIMGDRYCQYYSFDVARASAKWIDVASTNSGADWSNGGYARFYLDSLHKLTGKPVIVTEFYVGATQNRSGNKNSGDAFPKVQTQVERAQTFANCVQYFASLPFVVGAHWFQFYDEPEHGRGDGEDWNMGLVDTSGKPYEEMVDAAKRATPASVHAHAGALGFVGTVPEAPKNPLVSLTDWDKSGIVQPSSSLAHADLYICRDADAYYFGLYAMDYIDSSLYVGGRMPPGERPRLQIQIEGGPILEARFTADKGSLELIDTPPGVEGRMIGGLRQSVIIRVPKQRVSLRGALRFRATAWTHSRGRATLWSFGGVQ